MGHFCSRHTSIDEIVVETTADTVRSTPESERISKLAQNSLFQNCLEEVERNIKTCEEQARLGYNKHMYVTYEFSNGKLLDIGIIQRLYQERGFRSKFEQNPVHRSKYRVTIEF